MSDITEMFSRVAGEPSEPGADTVTGDIERGHRALRQSQRRQRVRRSAITATSVAAAAAVIVVGAQIHSGGAKPTTNTATRHSTTKVATKPAPTTRHKVKAAKHLSSIKLVAYHGKQLNGFTVDKVPAGWYLSTSTQYALLINPDGATNQDPSVFVDKLAVLTQSSDVHSLPKGTPVTVNGEDGTIVDQGKYGVSLNYNTSNGIGVVIQAPSALNWSDAQLVAFAEGVHMTGNAVASRG